MGTITNSIFLHRSARTTRQNAEHARPSPEPARGANGSGASSYPLRALWQQQGNSVSIDEQKMNTPAVTRTRFDEQADEGPRRSRLGRVRGSRAACGPRAEDAATGLQCLPGYALSCSLCSFFCVGQIISLDPQRLGGSRPRAN